MFVNTSLFYIIYLLGITTSILSYNIVFSDYDDPIQTINTIPEAFANIGDISKFSTYVLSIFAVYGAIIIFTITTILNILSMVIEKCTTKKKYVFNMSTKRWEYTTAPDKNHYYFEEDLVHSNINIRPVEFKELKHSSLTPRVESFNTSLHNKITVFYFIPNHLIGQFDNLIININEVKSLSTIQINPFVIIYNTHKTSEQNQVHYLSTLSEKVYIIKSEYKGVDVFYTNIYNPTKIKNCILSAYSKLIKNPEYNANILLASINENLSNYFFTQLYNSKTEFISFIYGMPFVDENTFSNAINTCVNEGASFIVSRNVIRPTIPSILKTPTTQELSKKNYVPWYKRLFYGMESIEYDINYVGTQPSELIRGFMFYLPPHTIWRLYSILDFRFKDIENNNCNVITEEDIDAEYTNRYIQFYDEMDMIYQGILSGLKCSYEKNSRFYTLSSSGLFDWMKKHYASCCIWIQIFKNYLIQTLNCCSKVSFKDRLLYILSFIYFEVFYYVSSQALPIIGLSIYYQLFNSNMNMLLIILVSYTTLPIQLFAIYMFNRFDIEIKHVITYHSEKSILNYLSYVFLFPFYNQFQFMIIVFSHIRMITNY